MGQRDARRSEGGRTMLAMPEGLPVRHRWVDIDGVTTSVVEGGEGPPMVLVHGGIQAGGLVWWRALGRLLARHRVVVPDLPGLGASERLPLLDAPTFGRWLGALVERTCPGPPALVAHSAPGALAARYAAQHGSALARLVLVDAAGLGPFRPGPGFLLALLRANLRPSTATAERFLSRVTDDLDRTRADAGDEWAAFVGHLVSRSSERAVRRTMRQLVRAGTKPVPVDVLARIEPPVGLLWGRHDPLLPPRIAEEASARLGWPLRFIDRAGHLPHLEQPDAFVDELAVLLESG